MKTTVGICVGLLISIAGSVNLPAQPVMSNRPPVAMTGNATSAQRVRAIAMPRTFAYVNATNQMARNAVRVQSPDTLRQLRLVSGAARADFGLHKAAFAASLGMAQPIAITTPDNRSLAFKPSFLAYHDTGSGKSVLLGTAQNVGGGVQPPDRVIYQDAFDGLAADVQYICTPYSLEQNVILRQHPPTPEQVGLNSATTRLEMWTEWFGAPPTGTQSSAITLRAGTNGLSRVTASDTALDFGTMKIVRGRAFSLDGAPDATPVAKEWGQFQGRNFLVETVDYKAIEPALQSLAAAPGSSSKPVYASREQMIQGLAVISPSNKSKIVQLSTFSPQPATASKGVVLDFTIVNAVPLPQGAIAWWPAGGDANDVLGGYNGTLQGGSSFGAGEVGQGFVLDGSSGYVSVPDNDAWAFDSDFTIEFWASFADYPSGNEGQPNGAVFISSDAGGGNASKWFLSAAGGMLNFHINDPVNGPVFLVNAGFTPDLNTWYHIALTRSGDTYTAYVNGQAIGSDTCDRAIPNADAPLMIGQAEGFFFNGSLDEMTIYNRALAPSEIQMIYNAGGAGKDNPQCVRPPANAIGWWPGDGNADDMVGPQNGTLQGGATYDIGEVNRTFSLDGTG